MLQHMGQWFGVWEVQTREEQEKPWNLIMGWGWFEGFVSNHVWYIEGEKGLEEVKEPAVLDVGF